MALQVSPLPWSTYHSHPPAGVRSRGEAGRLYSTKEGVEARQGALVFWFLQRSKKVWFRIDPALFGQPIPHTFTYRGRPILFSGDRSEPRSIGAAGEPRPIYWGERMESGWGHGPRRTNFFLSILTRWSLWHLAAAHPEDFRVLYWPEPSAADGPRAWARQN